MKYLPLLLFPLLLLAADDPGKPSPWDVPGDVPEMMAACQDIPALHNFARNGYLSIECGYQAILFGQSVPVAPAPHVKWASPYAPGKPKVLIITCFGNSPADTVQFAQMVRELDCAPRWVLIAHVPLMATGGHEDEAYLRGYLAPQARRALEEDYDLIIMSPGSYGPGFGYPLKRAIFPDDVYQTILDKVRAGTGLLTVGSNMGGWWLQDTPLLEAMPATLAKPIRRREVTIEAAADQPMFRGAPLANVPETGLYRWQPKEGATVTATEAGEPLVISGPYGQGKVTLLGWDGTLAPGDSNEARLVFEHNMAIALRAVTAAAGMAPPVTVVPRTAELAAGRKGTVEIEAAGAEYLHCTVRDTDFNTVLEDRVRADGELTTVAIDPLPTGDYWLDVIARTRKGASQGWGSAPLTITDPRTLTIETDKEIYAVGDRARITVRIDGEVERPTVTIRVADAMARILLDTPAEAAAGGWTATWPITHAYTAPHTIAVEVREAGNLLLRGDRDVYVPTHEWTDYENILWPGRGWAANTERAATEAGITAVLDSWGRDQASAIGAPHGIRPARMNDATINPGKAQTEPDVEETRRDETLGQAIDAVRRYGAVCFAVQDERHQGSDPGMPNEAGLARYRAYLAKQYGDIAALNASWETDHATFADVLPTFTKDLSGETRNLAPWLDFRLWVADECYNIDARHAAMIREVFDRRIPIGIDGFTSSGHVIPYGGLDIGRLAETGVFDFYCPYGDDLMIAALIDGPLTKYIGWGQSRQIYFGQPWRDAFRGHWGTFRFFGPTFFSQFGWTQPAGRWIAQGTEELRTGVGRALMGAERQYDEVAILYSYPSMIATAAEGVWVQPANTHLMWRPANWSREAFEDLLVMCGSTVDYVTEQQAVDGQLAGRKLLLIPHFMGAALRDDTCAAITRFVENGGIVVADMAPAVMDTHGKPRAEGGLNELFGIRRQQVAYAQRAADYLVGVTETHPLVPTSAWYVGQWYEEGLEVTDGKALGKHWFEDVPAMVVKEHGAGRALLMNFLWTSTVRRNGLPEAEDIAFMRGLLQAAGITPAARVETDYGARRYHCELNRLVDGPITWFGVYGREAPESDPAAMVVRWPTARETYDVRAGRYLGRVSEAPVRLFKYDAALFARLDYRIEGLSVEAANTRHGEPIELRLELETSAAPGRHVVHLRILDPDGEEHRLYTRNVDLVDGTATVTIPTALNDARGRWQVEAREVISGVSDGDSFRLR